MDVQSFLGGNFLTQLDIPGPSVVWHVRDVQQQLVGTDTKVCISFAEHQKPLGCNKTNLRVLATAWGVNSQAWIGRALELYRDQTHFQGRMVPCIRVRIPAEPLQAAPVQYAQPSQYLGAPQQPPVQYQPVLQPPQPAAAPVQQPMPVAAPQQPPVQASPGAPAWPPQ